MSSVLQPSLPSAAYVDPGFFMREKAGIFQREWMAACRTEQIASAGDWQVFNMAGDDVLVVRAKDGVVRAFHNVCRHRGARLCAGRDEPVKPGRQRCRLPFWPMASFAAPITPGSTARMVRYSRRHTSPRARASTAPISRSIQSAARNGAASFSCTCRPPTPDRSRHNSAWFPPVSPITT